VLVGNERRALPFGLDRKRRVMLGHVMCLQPDIGGFDRDWRIMRILQNSSALCEVRAL